ncbi:amidohydrolase [Patescibacteria group bacterium]|nr:amidohydrolase [Patescibacteria group bacterium]
MAKILVIIPVAVVLLAGLAFSVFSKTPKVITENLQNRKTCSRVFSPEFNDGPYYQGPFFDDHFHLPSPPNVPEPKMMGVAMPQMEKDVTIEQILCHFDEEQTESAVAFYSPATFPFFPDFFYNNKKMVNAANLKQQVGNRMHLFFSPVPFDAAKIDALLAANPGIFDGLGELALYATHDKPDSPKLMAIFKVADKYHLPVMFHPDMDELQNTARAAKAFPNVKMMVHGYQLASDMAGLDKLMGDNPNIYYSIDSATLYADRGGLVTDTEEQFVSDFKRDFNKNLNEQLAIWKPLVEKYPTRFMWGTDRFVGWHYSEQISRLFEEFARAFTGRLPKDLQEKYAYQNAEALFTK